MKNHTLISRIPSYLRLSALAFVLALPLALTACGGDDVADDVEGATQAAPQTKESINGRDVGDHDIEDMPMSAREMADGTVMDGDAVAARIEDRVQVVDIEAGRMGYHPRAIALEAGVPARLVFTRTVDSECSSQVKIPAFGVPVTDLPMDEPVTIEFTPDESGEFTFVCGMDMQRGSIMVRS